MCRGRVCCSVTSRKDYLLCLLEVVFWRLKCYGSISWHDLFLAKPAISGCKAAVIFFTVESRLWRLFIHPVRIRTQIMRNNTTWEASWETELGIQCTLESTMSTACIRFNWRSALDESRYTFVNRLKHYTMLLIWQPGCYLIMACQLFVSTWST